MQSVRHMQRIPLILKSYVPSSRKCPGNTELQVCSLLAQLMVNSRSQSWQWSPRQVSPLFCVSSSLDAHCPHEHPIQIYCWSEGAPEWAGCSELFVQGKSHDGPAMGLLFHCMPTSLWGLDLEPQVFWVIPWMCWRVICKQSPSKAENPPLRSHLLLYFRGPC